MNGYNLHNQIDRLNQTSGFMYRAMLAGVLAVHGKDAVVKELTGRYFENVVSIASAPLWCSTHADIQTKRVG
jgi:hypothetical protein